MAEQPAPRPRVSVVMIFLDERRFLAEAVASVRHQHFEDWELLLVDDGSTDGSTELARAFAAESPARIRYLEHQGHANRGMSAARNLGVARVRFVVVAFKACRRRVHEIRSTETEVLSP